MEADVQHLRASKMLEFPLAALLSLVSNKQRDLVQRVFIEDRAKHPGPGHTNTESGQRGGGGGTAAFSNTTPLRGSGWEVCQRTEITHTHTHEQSVNV